MKSLKTCQGGSESALVILQEHFNRQIRLANQPLKDAGRDLKGEHFAFIHLEMSPHKTKGFYGGSFFWMNRNRIKF